MGRIVGIGGKLASGKDTVADRLVRKGWLKFGMSDPLNEAMLTLNPIIGESAGEFYRYREVVEEFGYTEAKQRFPEVRRLLQIFGTEVGRQLLGVDVWVDIMKRRVRKAAKVNKVVITGIRFPNELEAIRDLAGELWWVDREAFGVPGTHASESSVGAEEFDVVIPNYGSIDDLHKFVETRLL